MAVPITIAFQDARKLAEGVWEVDASSDDFSFFGDAASEISGRSVVALTEKPIESENGVLLVERKSLRLLNRGTSDTALLVLLKFDEHLKVDRDDRSPISQGDAAFLDQCGKLVGLELRALSEKVVSGIRRLSQGELKEGKNRKFINRPDNFVTLTIQVRLRCLDVSIRGEPSTHDRGRLKLKRGMSGYSQFKIYQTDDLLEAMSLIEASWKRGRHFKH